MIVVAQIGMKLVQHEEPQTSVFPQPPGGALSYTTLDLPPDTDAVDSALYMGETGAGSIHRYLKAVMLQKGNCVRAHTFKIRRSRIWRLNDTNDAEATGVSVVCVNGATYATPATTLVEGDALTTSPVSLEGWELTQKGEESPLLLTQVQIAPSALGGEYAFYLYLSWEEEV